MASLRKLRGKYYVRIRFNGKEKLIGTKTTTRRDAEIHLHKWQENEQLVKFNMAEHLLDTIHTEWETNKNINSSNMDRHTLRLPKANNVNDILYNNHFNIFNI